MFYFEEDEDDILWCYSDVDPDDDVDGDAVDVDVVSSSISYSQSRTRCCLSSFQIYFVKSLVKISKLLSLRSGMPFLRAQCEISMSHINIGLND